MNWNQLSVKNLIIELRFKSDENSAKNELFNFFFKFLRLNPNFPQISKDSFIENSLKIRKQVFKQKFSKATNHDSFKIQFLGSWKRKFGSNTETKISIKFTTHICWESFVSPPFQHSIFFFSLNIYISFTSSDIFQLKPLISALIFFL